MTTNLPTLETALSQAAINLFGEPLLAGSFLLLSLLLVWSYVGGGLEVALIVFIPCLLLMYGYALVPTWVSLILSIALAFAVVFLFRGFGNR